MNKRLAFALATFASGVSASSIPAAAADQADKKNPAPVPAATPDAAPMDTRGLGANAGADGGAERVNVQKIKEKYWARGDQTELGVVQNRLYSKERRFEFGLIGGIVNSDPFLSIKNVGASFGFHFSEYFSTHIVAWKYYVTGSSANEVLEAGGKKANSNEPRDFVSAEARASLLYGKLSVIGKAIIYYDFHLIGGLGSIRTETSDRTGRSLAPYAGLGQHFYMSRSTSFNIDYRLMRYKDQPQEKEITAQLGTLRSERVNWAHSISLGFSILFGGPSQ